MYYWWIFCLIMILGFSGCVGSFMNVVIYRLPQGIPLSKPLWSFCPHCHHSIRWYDNIPVLSYFWLGGRCRDCGAAIAPRYVVIEVITMLAFLLLFDVFFVAHLRSGIASNYLTVGMQFYGDWPIYLAHGLLFACLIGMSVIDIEAYWVDIRFTHFAALAGFVLHMIWTPVRDPSWYRPGAVLGGAALAATLGAIVVHVVITWYYSRHHNSHGHAEPQAEGGAGASEEAPVPSSAPETPPGHAPDKRSGTFPVSAFVAGLILYYTLSVMVVTLIDRSDDINEPAVSAISGQVESFPRPTAAFAARTCPALAFVFLALITSAIIPRPADAEIEEALEAERQGARKVALTELGCLMLPVVLFGVTMWLVRPEGPYAAPWAKIYAWQVGRTQPLLGLGTAAVGYVVAGAVGWAVRIGFTLVLGKEAYGAGDIHIMAAAGAVAGWEVVVVGFFLSALLALVGWILTLPYKRGQALPMGPWLTLAFFAVVMLREPIIQGYLGPPVEMIMKHWFGHDA